MGRPDHQPSEGITVDPSSTIGPATGVAALLALGAVNALLWVLLAVAVGSAVDVSPSPALLAALAAATGAAVVVPTAARLRVTSR